MSGASEIFTELDRDVSLSAYAGAARKLKPGLETLPAFRAAVLANHTFDIGTTLTVECARRGLRLELYSGGYDQYRQELLDPHSLMDGFQPHAVLLSLVLPDELPGEPEWIADLNALLTAYRERSAAPVFIQNYLPPDINPDGLLGNSIFEGVMQLNAALRRMTASLDSIYIIDLAGLACRSGLAGWRDRRLQYLARAGINPKKFPALASQIARSFAALRRAPAKCLVIDLDNTLWGGILGELGAEGIHCAGTEYPASAYADFQKGLLALRQRGILLAVASKNDLEQVEECFRRRTDILIRPEHINDWEVHWEPKPESIRRIAARLNLGLDSIVFLDDNPAEVDLVKMALPQVRAHLMPPKPEEFVPFLAALDDFDQLQLSDEDSRRGDLYQLRRQQTELAVKATDIQSFFRSLQTVIVPEEATPANMDRIVQLFQKTNQFNLTTRRHGKAELLSRVRRGSELWAFRARDVHGDHGLIAVALLDFESRACTLDSFLMSCRVIGRTIETAILHFLESRALDRGASVLSGEYLETARNTPCRNFFEEQGYEPAGSRWEKNVKQFRTPCPEWITLEDRVAICSGS